MSDQREQVQEQHVAHGNLTKVFLRVAVLLAIITIVGVTIEALADPLPVTLILILTIIKFCLVVAYYMHLRWDNWFFTFLLATGCIMAVGSYLVVFLIIRQ